MNTKKSIADEDTTLNFRISKLLKAKIIAKAEKENVTSSKYLRDLLESVHDGSYCDQYKLRSEREDFLFSREFLQLIVWIYKKRENSKREVEKNSLEGYVKTLKRIDKYLPENLVREFDKVLNNLLFVRVGVGYDGDHFEFHKSYNNDKKFNCDELEKFLLNENVLEDFIEWGGSPKPSILI
ncbi:hypothetical protein [Psychroserpens sp. Hel_I_66]|uniref:hypothetical protein n=1 Tax=Psychroserpens sp. Hel_I_66 TaxID=1250004 RepID=UPI0006469298|nr:hypothetical protein [Psychroserpens sp. Hel_I_66]